jgi:hypothetical protein
VREVLTCPGCLHPFGITSVERYDELKRDGLVERVPVPPELAKTLAHEDVDRLPVAKPDPAGGYRCPRCAHIVA